jgi:hypothetical protein
MISNTLEVERGTFERASGWSITPEGACKDDRCVALSDPMPEILDLRVIGERLNMPLLHDEAADVWCLGPEAGGKALTSATAPELDLPDWHGDAFQLSSLRGKKVLLLAWASW